ncbi:hypothetical protein Q7P37_000487 [Cladosporium fusiforme]
MAQNIYPNGYQQPQYSQQGYQQSMVPNSYGNVQPQPHPPQAWGQQNNAQQISQIPMQQAVSTQPQPNQVAQPQQQWAQQYYQQGTVAQPIMAQPQPTMANVSYPQPQVTQNLPTTTTQKTSAVQTNPQGYNPSMTTNATQFSNLMQPTPQQQQPQIQAANQYSQMTQMTQNTQYTQNLPPPPVQAQSTTNFTHLMQQAPPTQQFTLPAPQSVSASATSNSTRRETLERRERSRSRDGIALLRIRISERSRSRTPPLAAPRAMDQHSHALTTTNTTSTTTVVGGKSRQQAANAGERELKRFDQHVTARLLLAAGRLGECPMEFDWYAVPKGYLCGGGNHFVTHEDVEAMLRTGQQPEFMSVNMPMDPPERLVTPPPLPKDSDGDFGDEPVFWTNSHRFADGNVLLPKDAHGNRASPEERMTAFAQLLADRRHVLGQLGISPGGFGIAGLGSPGLGGGRYGRPGLRSRRRRF